MDTHLDWWTDTFGLEECTSATYEHSPTSEDATWNWFHLYPADHPLQTWTEPLFSPIASDELRSPALVPLSPPSQQRPKAIVPRLIVSKDLEGSISGRTPRKVTEYQDRVRQQRSLVNKLLQLAEQQFTAEETYYEEGLVRQSITAALKFQDGAACVTPCPRPALKRAWSDPLGNKFAAASKAVKLARRREQQKDHKQRLRQSDLQNYQRLCRLVHIAFRERSQSQDTRSDWNLQQDERDLRTLCGLLCLSQADMSTLSTFEQRLTKTINGPLCSALSQLPFHLPS